MNKKLLFENLIEKIKAQMKDAENLKQLAQQEANSHIGAMQSRYDTFKEEAQYLVAVHTKQQVLLKEWMSILGKFKNQNPVALTQSTTKIQLGSIVKIAYDDNKTDLFFMLPAGGGQLITIENITYQILTHVSPLGKNIIGKNLGDVFFVKNENINQKMMILYVE